jgi:hypothetical protein
LLEYKKFKDAANLLEESAEIRGDRFTRPDMILAGLKDNAEPEIDLDQVSIWTLLEAFDGILKSVGHYQSYEHITDDTPIDLYQIEILHRLQTEGPLSMELIFKDRGNRLVMIGLFLGMLELIRMRLIWAEQPETKGTILIRALTDEPAEQAVPKAIYATEAESAHDQKPLTEPEAAVSSVSVIEDEDPELLEDDLIFDDEADDEPVEIPHSEAVAGEESQPRIPILELPAKPDMNHPSFPDDSLSPPVTAADDLESK